MRKLLNAAVFDWLLEVPCRVYFIAKFCGSLFVICCDSSEAFGRRGMLNLTSDTATAMSVVKKGARFSQHHSLPRGHFLATRMLALTFRSLIGRPARILGTDFTSTSLIWNVLFVRCGALFRARLHSQEGSLDPLETTMASILVRRDQFNIAPQGITHKPTDASYAPYIGDPRSGRIRLGQLGSAGATGEGYDPSQVKRMMKQLWAEYVEANRGLFIKAHEGPKAQGSEPMLNENQPASTRQRY